jgi:hypothetical protein
MQVLLEPLKPYSESENTEVETALLRNGNGHFLVLVNHSSDEQDAGINVRFAAADNMDGTDLLQGRQALVSAYGNGCRLSTRIGAKEVLLFWIRM